MEGRGQTVVTADLGGGRTIKIEARPMGPMEKRVASSRKVFSFDDVTSSIEAIAERVTAALAKVQPDRAAVEFGVDIGVETSGLTALIAKGSGTATLKITLEWDRGPSDDAGS